MIPAGLTSRELLARWEAMFRSGRCFSSDPADKAEKAELFARMRALAKAAK